RALIERVRARVPEIVYSWPEHVRDEPAEPSPLLRGLAVHGASAGVHASSAGKRAAARRRETLLDPPPPLGGNAVRGGTAALDAPSICPLRAFCAHRLGARPLVPIERGLSPAARGRIVHRALERLFRALDSRAALERAGPQLVETTIRREARRAAAEIVGRGHALLGALADIEATRAAEVVSALVARELERAPFRVESLELERTIELCGRTLRVRIDR